MVGLIVYLVAYALLRVNGNIIIYTRLDTFMRDGVGNSLEGNPDESRPHGFVALSEFRCCVIYFDSGALEVVAKIVFWPTIKMESICLSAHGFVRSF